MTLNATTNVHVCERNPQTNCGFNSQFEDSLFNLRIPLTVADSATA